MSQSVQPNAHPYAIKTTSSALLSRSSSSPHTPHHNRHHYVPLKTPATSRARHRHSSSCSSVERNIVPAPLPTPDMSFKPKLTQRPRRPGTVLGSTTAPTVAPHIALPPNPKQWNTDELATYLGMSLRSDDLVAILECVRARNLTGRELLRLTSADLADTSLSHVQRAQLLNHSRILRADVLRGRIYVDSYHSCEISDNSNDVYSTFPLPLTPLGSIRGASMSLDSIHSLLDNHASEDEYVFPPSPATTLHRSNSVSDPSAERYRDLARMRMRRRGRVKGLVESWERTTASGSECSAEEWSEGTSDADSTSQTDPQFPTERSTESRPDPPSATSEEVTNVMIVDPVPVNQDVEEEPTIEELLASSSHIPLTGARAWEADFGLGETVKRIPAGASPDPDESSSFVLELDLSRRLNKRQQASSASMKSNGSGLRTGTATGSRRKNANAQKRVVTAIFTGSVSDEDVDLGHHDDECHAYDAADEGALSTNTNSYMRDRHRNDSDSGLRALEESIAATRAQMDAFRARLEDLEADTARQEVMLTHAQSSRHTSATGLRLRRSETTEMTETVERPRPRDVLECWETLSLAGIARAIIAKAMGWIFPYGHVGAHSPTKEHDSKSYHSAGGKTGNESTSPVKGSGGLLARTSCSIVLISFALCAAVLRRVGFGRWVRRP